ncbi:MAG: DUF1501 domain-containing protein [Fuerstiella sp.]
MNGRDRNPYGFSIRMAGGGIRGGVTHGETDEIGLYAINGTSYLEQFTYCRGRYWLVGVTKLLSKSVLRGHKSA